MAKPDIPEHTRTFLDEETLWKLILEINTYARTHPAPRDFLKVVIAEQGFEFFPDEQALSPGEHLEWLLHLPHSSANHQHGIASSWDGLFRVAHTPAAAELDTGLFLRDYLPYALLPWKAATLGRAMTVAHFAQSLDGKIATRTGHSRWIGNQENLHHAHRMRALCEGILIGKGTLTSDEPSLTVRHVPGKNPQRIILSSNPCNFDSLFRSSQDEVWWIGGDSHPSDQVRCIEWNGLDKENPCEDLLELLFQQGITTVFIEGGSRTTSAFLKEGVIDIMQFHISPLVFGSGIPGIALPEIDQVDQSISFSSWEFLPVGDSVMFVGNPTSHES